ncbi:MAG: polyprenyl synthetase family protein [Nocardioidaceae bacterium]
MSESPSGEPTGRDPIPEGFKGAITQILEAFLARQHQKLAPLGADLDSLFDAAHRALEGGKRLRPAFAYWGWRAAGGPVAKTQSLLYAAAAIELVHASALTHDDVMDASQTRRGGPSAHRAFAALAGGSIDDARAAVFGMSAAILLGDILLSWSDELMRDSGFRPKAIDRGQVYFDRLRSEVVAGQYLDVLSQTKRRTSGADAMKVLLYKSAKYTVERPLQLGAALGKASPQLLAALSSYGVPLGEAFQLRDDVLGVYGDPSSTGKPAGDDLREGKRTALVAAAMTAATRAQAGELERHLGDPGLDAAGVAALREVIADTGALRRIEALIADRTAEALRALDRAALPDEAGVALAELATAATDRNG